MKISRINIKSFGNVNNWSSGELDSGLNIVYGPNESGKSTITEFVRSTFFPNKARGVYPGNKKSDFGTVEVVMDNGDRRILERDGKSIKETQGKRTVSEEFNNIDVNTYRSLYGLDLELLTDSKSITSSGLKTRFLTIPGGENIPAVSDYLDAEIEKYLTQSRRSDAKIISKHAAEIKNAEEEIASIEESMNEYNNLKKEREELVFMVEGNKAIAELNANKKAKRELQRSQKANIERYEELKEKVDKYAAYKDFDINERTKYLSLRSELDEIQKKLPINGMKEKDLNAILVKESEIQTAWANRPDYDHKKGEIVNLQESIDKCTDAIEDLEKATGWKLSDARNVKTDNYILTKAENVSRNRRKNTGKPDSKMIAAIAMIVGGLIVAAIGMFVPNGAAISVFGGLIAVAGIIFLAVQWRKGRTSEFIMDWDEWIKSEGYPAGITPEETVVLVTKLRRMIEYDDERKGYESQMADAKATVSLYEKTVKPLISTLKIDGDDISDCVAKLHQALLDAKAEEANESKIRDLISEADTKKAEISKILRKYGGEEEFLAVADCKEKYDAAYSEMVTLKESIESTVNMPVDNLIVVLNDPEQQPVEEIEDNSDQWNQRIGEITQQLEYLMQDGEYDRLQSLKAMHSAQYREALKEWATLSVAQTLVRDSCNRFYSDLQPTVVKTANTYLSLMTEGRYKLDSDPREKDLAIVDVNGNRKDSGQWSSGLADQVYLSLKMALAKEMSSERMPLLLDDILVRFDVDRKRGACKAILEYAKDVQVIMFTCDNRVANLFKLEGEFNEIML